MRVSISIIIAGVLIVLAALTFVFVSLSNKPSYFSGESITGYAQYSTGYGSPKPAVKPTVKPTGYGAKPAGTSCTDSDAFGTHEDGVNYFVKGNLSLTGGSRNSSVTDFCVKKSRNLFGINKYARVVSCEAGKECLLAEYNCPKSSKKSYGRFYACPEGCSDGACKKQCPNTSAFQLSPKHAFCYEGQVCNNYIELIVDYQISSLRGFLKYTNGTIIQEFEFTSPKENKYISTIQISNPIGNYSVQIIDNSCILHQFNITTLNFEGIGFKIIKSAIGNKITLAYNSKYFNLSDVEEISKVTTGLKSQEGLFNISPILKYVNNFEIVAITLPEDSSLGTEAIINHFAPDINRRFILDIPLIVSEQRISVLPRYLTYAIKPWHVNENTHSLILNLFEQQSKFNAEYFAHEFGHAFSNNGEALLQDEYHDTCTIDGCRDSFTTQGLNINSPNLDSEGCPKWCNGELDSTKPHYNDYIEVKDCLGQYFDVNNDWMYLGLPPSSRQIKECLGYTLDANGKEIGYKYSSTYFTWDLGRDCLTGTGCYFTANKVMDWRSQNDSIMNSMNMDFGYGKVSEQVIETKILELIS